MKRYFSGRVCKVLLVVLTVISFMGTQGAAQSQRTAGIGTSLSLEAREAIERAYSRIAAEVNADDIGGITAAVARGEELLSVRGFGWADKENRIPAAAETIYRIGSISKSITAVALAVLAERGVVKLDDPVENYLPEIKNLDGYAQYSPITLRQLASHTAGLIREPKLENAAAGPIAEWEEKVLASIPRTSFFAAPGARFQYSNIGYGILGLTISRVAEKPFMELVEELIFHPLGMHRSTFIITDEQWKYLAVGYRNGRDGVVNTDQPLKEHAGRGYKVPNGGVYTTVGDLAKFIASQTGTAKRTILSVESLAEIQRVQTPDDGGRQYGLGFFIETTKSGTKVVSHTGGVAGYRVYHGFDPYSKFGVILFRNYNVGKTDLRAAGTELLDQIVVAERQVQASHKP